MECMHNYNLFNIERVLYMSMRYNLQHIMTSLLISSVLTWIKRSMLDAALYRKKLNKFTEKPTLRNSKGVATSQVQLANQMITLACCRV